MSTFGKKALIWWDYYNNSYENCKRYNLTPKDMQLKILEKWYPIGMKCNIEADFNFIFSSKPPSPDNIYHYEIIGYSESLYIWQVNIKVLETYKNYKNLKHDYLKPRTKSPLHLIPDKDFIKLLKREYKLKRILDGDSKDIRKENND